MRLWRTAKVLILMAAVVGGTSAHASNLIEEGKEHFKARRFYAAEDCFNRASQTDPQNQLIHYYLGQTLEQLYDAKAAKAAYTDCFRINPFNEQGVAAKQALVHLSGRVEAEAHAPVDDVKVTAKTIEMINRQVADGQARYVRWGNSNSAHAISIGNMSAARMGYDAQMSLRGVRRGGRLYDYGGGRDVSNSSEIRSSWIRADAQREALKHQIAAVQSCRELAASAANLEALIAEKKRPGEAKLRALGTQLYVRYYGDEDHESPTPPQDPPIELRATELSLKGLSGLSKIATKSMHTEPEPFSLSQAAGLVLRSKY